MMKKSPKGNKSLKQNQYNSKTFFDKECYEQKLILRKCLRKYKRKNNNENKTEYTECRKKYKSFIENKKKIFNKSYVSYLLNNFNNSKLFWKEIKSITLHENNYNNIETEQFYIYFKSVFQKDFSPPPICLEPNQTAYITFDDQNETLLDLNADITLEEVESSLSSIKSSKSPGTDCILNEMLKSTSNDITPFLQSLFQYLFKSHIFPTEWKKSIIIPVFKKR